MNRALTYTVVVMICVGFVYAMYAWGSAEGRKAEALTWAPVQKALTQCEALTGRLEDELADQNAQIIKLETDSQAAELRARRLVDEARRNARVHEKRANQLLAAQPKSEDRCEAATILIREYLQ